MDDLPVTDVVVPTAGRSAGDLLRRLEREFDRFAIDDPPPVEAVVGLEEVVTYFARQQRDDRRIVAGALLARRHPQGTLLLQVFLDGEGHPRTDDSGRPYGRRLVAACTEQRLRARLASGDGLLVFR